MKSCGDRTYVTELQCGRLENGFLRVRCDHCHQSAWWYSPAREEASAPAVAPAAWWTVPPCWINDFPAGRLLRDAKLYEIGAGTSKIRRTLIARKLFDETGGV